MRTFISTCLALLLVRHGVWGQDAGEGHSWDCPATGYLPFRHELLVSTADLAYLLEEDRVLLVHVGPDPADPGAAHRIPYDQAHIPGAVELRWTDLGKDLRDSRRIVFYDTGVGRDAAAAYVALDARGGAENASLLDGQWTTWALEGRPLSRRAAPAAKPAEELPAPGTPRLRVSAGDLRGLLQASREPDPTVTLLDVRAGEAPTGSLRRIPWTATLQSLDVPVLRSERELRGLFAGVPARPEQRILVAGRNWRDAAHGCFVAKLLGYSVQVYDGPIDDLIPDGEPSP